MNEAAPRAQTGKFKSAQWGVSEKALTNRERWLCFWSLFVFGSCCVYQWLMPASILTNIGAVFEMSLDTAGWIMSVFTLTGLVLAYPGAWIMRNVGIKVSILIAALLTISGNVLALVADSGVLFIVARAIQGCGFGLIAVIGPNIMPRLFPLERQGLVMGIWSQWVCPGVALAALSTPLLYGAFGWRSIFCLSLVLQVVTTLLVLVFVKMPAVPENAARTDAGRGGAGKPSRAYVASAFAVGFCFLAWCTSYPTFNTFYPTYAQTVQGMDMFTASMTTLVAAIATIPGGILFGLLADKIKQRKLMLVIGYVLLIAVCATVLWAGSQNQHILPGILLCGPRSHHVARAHPGACPGSSGYRLCSDRHGVRDPARRIHRCVLRHDRRGHVLSVRGTHFRRAVVRRCRDRLAVRQERPCVAGEAGQRRAAVVGSRQRGFVK